jgi:hypothetical protein
MAPTVRSIQRAGLGGSVGCITSGPVDYVDLF